MHIVLLSGGSGRRLWPLSNEIRSKQFIKFFKKEDGTYESMLQRVHRQIRSVDPNATITIATIGTTNHRYQLQRPQIPQESLIGASRA